MTAYLLLVLLLIGCSAIKGGGILIITNEYRGDCIVAQPGRGFADTGRTREGAPCHSIPSMGMVPVFTYRW